MGVLCGQVSGLEILLCEGGDVELCARISKHISVFAIDPLSLTLSYIVSCVDSYCHIILICLVVFVCVSHLCLMIGEKSRTKVYVLKWIFKVCVLWLS